jgi:hypothetical protein
MSHPAWELTKSVTLSDDESKTCPAERRMELQLMQLDADTQQVSFLTFFSIASIGLTSRNVSSGHPFC